MSEAPLHLDPGQWFVLNGALYGRCAHCVRPILPSHPSVLTQGAIADLAIVPPTKLAYHAECLGKGATTDVAEEALATAIARLRAEMGAQIRTALNPGPAGEAPERP